jgi:hypothetical protein
MTVYDPTLTNEAIRTALETLASDRATPRQVAGTVTVTGTATVTPATGTAYSQVTTASTNAAVVKASAGTLYEVTVSNATATATFVKLYNKATAPTVGTDVPVLTIPAAAGATVALSLGAIGKRFPAGIAIACTAAVLSTNSANAVAGCQIHATYL